MESATTTDRPLARAVEAPDASVVERFGRRELNFAESRLGLLHATMELAEEAGLAEIPVAKIAQRAGVSRMTFFNRFPEKDSILLYAAWTWWFEDTVRQALDPVRGIEGIRRIFQRVAEGHRDQRRFFEGFAGYITRMEKSRPLLDALKLTAAEKALLRPDVEAASEMEVVPMQGQLRRFLEEAVEDGAVREDADIPSLITDLAAAIYGEILMAVVTGRRDLWPRYERQLERIAGWSAPRPG